MSMNQALVPADVFAIRAPLLPMSAYLAWSRGHKLGSYNERVLAVTQNLSQYMARPEVREAIVLASPKLHDAWEALDGDLEAPAAQRVVRSLMRYFARMCSRSTPFGLFAGHGLGRWGSCSDIQLGPAKENTRYTQPDSGFLAEIGDALQADRELREHFTWWANSSLYRVRGGYKYVREELHQGRISHRLVRVETSEYLEAILSRATRGATAAQLIESVSRAVGDTEATSEEIAEYIGELVAAQLLTANLKPISSGPSPLEDFIAVVPDSEHTFGHIETLKALSSTLQSFDARGLGVSAEEYRKVQRSLTGLPRKPAIDRLFQVDMFLEPRRATLSHRVRREVERSARLLQQLNRPHANPLRNFISKFEERYGDSSVPLMVALDPEDGVGFEAVGWHSGPPSPLIKGLPFKPENRDATIELGARESWLLARVRQDAGCSEIVLSTQELEALAEGGDAVLPDSFSVMFSVAAASGESVDAGEFDVILKGVMGPSGARAFGRFCYGDAELLAQTKNYLRREEELCPDVIYAEVVHLPEGRVANVIARPQLREHEICLLGTSSSDAQKIPVSDLRLRVVDGVLEMVSESRNKRVVPRITNAHNLAQGVGVYQFLGQLQAQHSSDLTMGWGQLSKLESHLPRLRHGRVVLCCAQWRVDRGDIMLLNRHDGEQRFALARDWQQKRGMPRFIELVDGDNTLLVDFENPLSVDTFAHLIRGRQSCIVAEVLLEPEKLWVGGEHGCHSHEFIAPFSLDSKKNAEILRTSVASEGKTQSAFSPGSEWLYYKIYANPGAIDSLLTEVLGPRIQDWLADGTIDRWFFLRYGDPDTHLRIRFHGRREALSGRVLPEVCRVLQSRSAREGLTRVCIDTYIRESERYGGCEAIELAESIFAADSDAALAILRELDDEDGPEARWKLCIRGLDQLMRDFGYDVEEKRSIMAKLRAGYREEFSAKAPLLKQVGRRFREEAPELRALLDYDNDAESWLEPGLVALRKRSVAIASVCREYKVRAHEGALGKSLEDIVMALLHMHTNRLIATEARAHELVMYDFLFRLYDARLARRAQRSC